MSRMLRNIILFGVFSAAAILGLLRSFGAGAAGAHWALTIVKRTEGKAP